MRNPAAAGHALVHAAHAAAPVHQSVGTTAAGFSFIGALAAAAAIYLWFRTHSRAMDNPDPKRPARNGKIIFWLTWFATLCFVTGVVGLVKPLFINAAGDAGGLFGVTGQFVLLILGGIAFAECLKHGRLFGDHAPAKWAPVVAVIAVILLGLGPLGSALFAVVDGINSVNTPIASWIG
jgi:hypothetical protein